MQRLYRRALDGLNSLWQGEGLLSLVLFLIAFCVCFNYTLLRNAKEALVVTVNQGAGVLPFIKVWALLPVACLMTALFTCLAMRFSKESIFQGVVGGFLLFFLLFLYLLYPSRETLVPTQFVHFLQQHLPPGGLNAVGMVAHWPFSCFYVVAELWGALVLSVLFWGLVNCLVPLNAARVLYPLLNISGHLGCMLAGQIPILLRTLPSDQALGYLIGCALFSGFCIMLLVHALYRFSFVQTHAPALKPSSNTLSGLQSFSHVLKSRPLQAIATMVIGYSLLVYMTEVFWKDSLQQRFPDFRDYNAYVGGISTYVSLISIPMAFLMPTLLRLFGWRKIALLSPLLLSISSSAFALSFLYASSWMGAGAGLYTRGAALDMLISLGSIHMTLALSCKYALFDPTKEMAFIPLDPALKWTGKAFIDGAGSRFAHSMSSILMQAAMLSFGSLTACAPYLFPLLIVVVVLWMRSVHTLSEQLPALGSGQEKSLQEKQGA